MRAPGRRCASECHGGFRAKREAIIYRLHLCLLLAAGLIVGAPAPIALAQSANAAPPAARTFVKAPPGFMDACRRYDWLCDVHARAAQPLDGDQLLALARSVNRRVNGRITQLSDAENYGVADHWTLPANGRGDCEDIVLLKYRLLHEAGVDSRDLSMAIALDHAGENHAVLIMRHETGDLVLDSLTSRIEIWNETGYRFLAVQSVEDNSVWEVVAGRPRSNIAISHR